MVFAEACSVSVLFLFTAVIECDSPRSCVGHTGSVAGYEYLERLTRVPHQWVPRNLRTLWYWINVFYSDTYLLTYLL